MFKSLKGIIIQSFPCDITMQREGFILQTLIGQIQWHVKQGDVDMAWEYENEKT